jgi:arsenite methyltransferase
MTTTDVNAGTRPNAIGRFRSRQAGHPSGVIGRLIGRAMVKDTAAGNDRALELLDLDEPRTVLEIGFGQGRTVAKLVDEGHRVLGADVSETMLKQATTRNRQAVRDGRVGLKMSDGFDLPFSDDAADVAFTTHTVYFMPDPAVTIADVARVLKPGGRFVIACRVGDDEMPAWMDRSIYQIPTVAEIQTMLDEAGFDRVEHFVGNESTAWTHWFTAEA